MTFVKTVARPGRYGDGCGSHGLSLLVKPMKLGGNSRIWSQRLRINGKPVSIGLGSFPVVTLAGARKAALENRRALARVRNCGAWSGTKVAFEFLVLTACWPGEVRLSEWREVDLDSRIWTIPADRSKTRREYRVPLAPGALDVPDEARRLSPGEGLIFPTLTGKPLSGRDAVEAASGAKHPGGPAWITARRSATDWCRETGQPREVAEACLAHAVRSKVEAAHARSDLLNRRRIRMQACVDYFSNDA